MKENAFRSKRSNIEKIPILRAEVERLESYKCLGVHLDNRLDWILKKWTVNRIYWPRFDFNNISIKRTRNKLSFEKEMKSNS